MLKCCVRLRRLSVTLCIVAKRCVLEQTLLSRAYRKSYSLWEIDWYQSKWPWPLFRGRIKVTSTVALHLLLKIEASFQRTTNRKWLMSYRMVTWPITSRDLERSNSTPKRLDLETPFRRTTNRKCHMGYQIVTWSPKVLWRVSTIGYPSDSLASCLSICDVTSSLYLHELSLMHKHHVWCIQMLSLYSVFCVNKYSMKNLLVGFQK